MDKPKLPLQIPMTLVLLLGQLLPAQDGVVRPSSPHRGGHSLISRNNRPANSGMPVRQASQAQLSEQPPMDIPPTEFSPPVQIERGGDSIRNQNLDPNSSMDFSNAPKLTPIESHRWTFNFQNATWLLVLRAYAKEFGLALQISTETDGMFSYYDEKPLNATETLDILNDALLASGRILIRDQQRLTLVNATEEIPGNIVPFVSIHHIDTLGRNELATVAIPLRGPDAEQTIAEIGQLQSTLGQVRVLTSAGRVVVTDTGSYLRRMRDLLLGSGLAAGDQHAHVYQLKNARAEDVAKAITDFLNAGSAAGATGDPAAGSANGTPAGQRVVSEKNTNSLLVRGTSEELATIERLVAELDRAPREVLVQALLVEVELGNVNELGVEMGFQDSVLFDRSVVDKLVTVTQTTTAPNGTQTTNQNIISQTAAPGFNFMGQPPGNNVAANPGRVAPQGLSSFGMGRVNGDLGFGGLVLSAGSESVNVLLRALDANFNIEVLSRPQVRSVENHEAFIQIGQQVPVVDGVSLTPVGSANPQIRQDKAGIILRVTPRISPDARVQLDVEAEKSSFNLTPGSGVPIFTDATNGNVIEAPIKDLTTAQTTVSVQSGHTIVLGGMITNDQTTATRKLPWLGDIPILGRLFRYDYNRLKRKELLVFLTPTVLDDEAQVEGIQQREMDRINLPAEAWNVHDSLASPQGTGELYPEDSQELPEAYSDEMSRNSLTDDSAPANTRTASRSSNSARSSGHSMLQASHSTEEQPQQPARAASGTNSRSNTAAPDPKSSWRPSGNYRGPATQPPTPPDPPEKAAGRSWNPLRFQRKPEEPTVDASMQQTSAAAAAAQAARAQRKR